MYFTFPPDVPAKEFRTRITETGEQDYTVSIPAIIQTLFRGLAFEYLASLNLKPRDKMIMMYFINKCAFKHDEPTRELAKKTGMSKQTVITALKSLEDKRLINRQTDARNDIHPFASRMLTHKGVYDILPYKLEELVQFFDRKEEKPVMPLVNFIGEVFSFSPQAFLVRFLRTCLLSGFDPDYLTEERIEAFLKIILSKNCDKDSLLLNATLSKGTSDGWRYTLDFYNKELDTKEKKENSDLLKGLEDLLSKIESILEAPKKVEDCLVG